ncbi:50S ribosome-binding GTPase [Rhizoctonia solani 123E]|uniref:50S ribosome-binding GTPase n=1 Tax=Rhizoctonia solani 123E TaxID=1423351 RepID=A0A074S1G1_9AGAM|nr:50S ribosome-binding GTPase [Rhizoctonia solani 123E]
MSHDLEESETRSLPINGSESQLAEANVILLFGCTGTGKTSFANIASGSEMQVGKGLRSSTKHLEASNTFQVGNKPVIIVDCPGFNDTYLTETEILRRLADFLIQAYTSNYDIVGFLYFHNITDTRVGGASFLHMNLFKALCGPIALKNAIYVTNMWSEPPTEDQIMREAELRGTDKFFGAALVEGAQMARHYNTQESAHTIIQQLLGKDTVVTKLQCQLVDDKIPLEDTDAGLVIGEDLEDDLRKQQQEMNDLKNEKEKALESDNQNWLRRLEAQEERTKAKEQQLIDQLRVLKSEKKNQPKLTSPQDRRDQGVVINRDYLALQIREQMEAKIHELTQDASRHSGPLHSYLPSQQDWDRQREEELARDIERIKAGAAYSRSKSHGNRGAIDRCLSAGGSVLSTFARISGFGRDASPSAVGDGHHYGGALPQGPVTENVGGSFGSPRPAWSPSFDDTRYQRGQTNNSSRPHRSGGHISTHDGREAYATGSKKQTQGHESKRVPDRRDPPSGNEY